MRPVFAVISVCFAALCFYAGYKIGSTQREVEVVVQPAPDTETKEEKPQPVEESTVAEPEPVDLPENKPDLPEPIEEVPLPTEAEMAERATNEIITLTDQQGRELDVEILELREESIRVRRQYDFRIVDVSLDMLSAEDRAFAAYLLKKQAEAPEIEADPEMTRQQQELYDLIFGK